MLTGTQAYKINSATKLTEFRDQIIDMLGLDASAAARWEVKRDKFLEDLPEILAGITPPTIVSFDEHNELKEKYGGALAELKKSDEECGELKKQMEQLKKCKDREEVIEVERNFTGELGRFSATVRRSKRQTEGITSGRQECDLSRNERDEVHTG